MTRYVPAALAAKRLGSVPPVIRPGERMITEIQAYTLRVLHGRLGRAVPELADLTFEQAGVRIIELRAELTERVSAS